MEGRNGPPNIGPTHVSAQCNKRPENYLLPQNEDRPTPLALKIRFPIPPYCTSPSNFLAMQTTTTDQPALAHPPPDTKEIVWYQIILS
jgi:hypothetical protein